jgi:thiamine kinase-like enzyme
MKVAFVHCCLFFISFQANALLKHSLHPWDGNNQEQFKQWVDYFQEATDAQVQQSRYIDPLSSKKLMRSAEAHIFVAFLKKIVAVSMKDKWSEECGSDLECDGSWESHLEVQDLSGNSNFVYIVRLSDGLRKKVRVPDVLVRVYGYIEPDDVEGTWERSNEEAVFKSHCDHKRGPELYREGSNFRIEKFFTGASMVDIYKLETDDNLLKEVVTALADYHNLKDDAMPPSDGSIFSDKFFSAWSTFSMRRTFSDPAKTKRVSKMNMPLMYAIGTWLQDEFSLMARQQRAAWIPVWTHNSAHPGNMLLVQGRIQLIDFDTTLKGYALYDLAVMTGEFASPSVDPKLVKGYYPGFNADLRRLPTKERDLEVLKIYSKLRGWPVDDHSLEQLHIEFMLARVMAFTCWFFWSIKKTSAAGPAIQPGYDYLSLGEWYANSAKITLQKMLSMAGSLPWKRRLDFSFRRNGLTPVALFEMILQDEPLMVVNNGVSKQNVGVHFLHD